MPTQSIAPSQVKIVETLDSLTTAIHRREQLLLTFIEQNGLTSKLAEFIESQSEYEPDSDAGSRLLQDIDSLMMDLSRFAKEKVRRGILLRTVILDENYNHPSTGKDLTFAKCCMSALGEEVKFQYRPLCETKDTKALMRAFKNCF